MFEKKAIKCLGSSRNFKVSRVTGNNNILFRRKLSEYVKLTDVNVNTTLTWSNPIHFEQDGSASYATSNLEEH